MIVALRAAYGEAGSQTVPSVFARSITCFDAELLWVNSAFHDS